MLWAVGFFAAVLGFRAVGVRRGPLYFVLGAAAWVALLASGVDPVVVGLAMGLLVWAYPAGRSDFELAGERFRAFREQPTPELERSAREGLSAAISPNERLLHLYHPWTSYVIVPLFAFANAGIAIDAGLLERAVGSPVTLGILFGYLIGKPVGILGVSLLVTRLSRGRLRPPVGWAAVLGAGTVAGVGFTISLLVATLAFDGARLEEAKFGILAAAGGASTLTWLVFGATALLPRQRRIAALLGGEEPLVDLAYDVDPDRDHVRGPLDAPVTVVEYGDFECPYCGRAEPAVRELLRDFADVRYVWRHLPLADVHPNAQLAAEASEAAAAQGAFWPMHDLLLEHQDALGPADLVGYADQLGLDVERFKRPSPRARRRRTDSPRTSRAPTSAASPAPRPSSSTGAATTAPTTSPPSRPPSVGPARGRAGGVPNGRASPDRQTRPRPHRNHPPGRRLQRMPLLELVPRSLGDYEAAGGGRGLQAALGAWPLAVIGEVARSGLRGRGGAGFPTGEKWRSVRGSGPALASPSATPRKASPPPSRTGCCCGPTPTRSSRAWPSPPTRSAPSGPTWA